jgi:hypothetical protein
VGSSAFGICRPTHACSKPILDFDAFGCENRAGGRVLLIESRKTVRSWTTPTSAVESGVLVEHPLRLMQAGGLPAIGRWSSVGRRSQATPPADGFHGEKHPGGVPALVFVEPSSIDADGAVTPLGSCFSLDAAQEWSAKLHSWLMASITLLSSIDFFCWVPVALRHGMERETLC